MTTQIASHAEPTISIEQSGAQAETNISHNNRQSSNLESVADMPTTLKIVRTLGGQQNFRFTARSSHQHLRAAGRVPRLLRIPSSYHAQ
jgi:hypothetical protein